MQKHHLATLMLHASDENKKFHFGPDTSVFLHLLLPNPKVRVTRKILDWLAVKLEST
jgi:hypothetical protein